MKKIKIIITGPRVQGVFFRAGVLEEAISLDLKGYVKNNEDGSIEAVFIGDENDIDEILEYCREGPSKAKVSDIEILEEDEDSVEEYDNFQIRY